MTADSFLPWPAMTFVRWDRIKPDTASTGSRPAGATPTADESRDLPSNVPNEWISAWQGPLHNLVCFGITQSC